jgi:hypothetical protein
MTMDDDNSILPPPKRTPWNKGKLIPRAGRSRDRGEQRYCGAAEAVFFVVGEEVLAFVDELANGCGGDVVSASYA